MPLGPHPAPSPSLPLLKPRGTPDCPDANGITMHTFWPGL